MDSRYRLSRVYQRLSISVFDVRRHLFAAMGFTAEQKAKFEVLYKAVTSVADDTKLVQMVDNIMDLLLAAGEAQIKNVDVSRVVPHSANRGGALMEAHKVYTKGSKILSVGFSLNRCDTKRAVAFQSKPGDSRDIMKFVDHANRSEHFANFNAEDVEACSVGCGHLNQFLAAIKHECVVPSAFENDVGFFDNRGGKKLDKHLLCKSQGKQLSTTLDIGLKWTFIPFKFEQQYPLLPNIIQKSLNVDQHIAEGESWDEQFRSIAQGIVNECKDAKKTKIDYEKIAKQVLASEPPRRADVPSHVDFCKKWGGGPTQSFAFDICTFVNLVRTHVVHASVFDALSGLKLKSDSMCPHFVAAVVKCVAYGSKDNGRGDIVAHLTAGDIKQIAKEIDVVLEAEDFMKKAKAIQESLGNANRIAIARGEMECSMVDFVLKKTTKADRDKTSLADISRSQYGNAWKQESL